MATSPDDAGSILPPLKPQTPAVAPARERLARTRRGFETHPPFIASRRAVYAYVLLLILAGSVTVIILFSANVVQPERYEEVSAEALKENFGETSDDACGKGGQRRVMNGACVPDGQFPSVVYLQFNTDRGASMCTGTLISRSWVLTAAHCLPAGPNVKAIVKAGCTDLYADDTCAQHAVTRMIPHPCYARPGNHIADIMVVELKNPVPTKIPLLPINGVTAVPRRTPPLPGTDTVGIGFGWMNNAKEVRFLQSAWAHVVTPNACSDFTGRPSGFPPICVLESEETGPHMCRGDSGGPLFVSMDRNQTVYGILAVGGRRPGLECLVEPDMAECCVTAPRFVTYVDVSLFGNWVNSVITGTARETTCYA